LEKNYPSAKGYLKGEIFTLYRGKGCAACNHTGYKGRIAIFELINMTPEMKDLILQNPSTNQIWDLAKAQGARSLFEDGLEKVLKGVTTIEELLRVAEPPQFKGAYVSSKAKK
jgi:type IV pilus assembly protein PilB